MSFFETQNDFINNLSPIFYEATEVNVLAFLEFIYSSSPQMQKKNVTTLKKFRPCLRS